LQKQFPEVLLLFPNGGDLLNRILLKKSQSYKDFKINDIGKYNITNDEFRKEHL